MSRPTIADCQQRVQFSYIRSSFSHSTFFFFRLTAVNVVVVAIYYARHAIFPSLSSVKKGGNRRRENCISRPALSFFFFSSLRLCVEVYVYALNQIEAKLPTTTTITKRWKKSERRKEEDEEKNREEKKYEKMLRNGMIVDCHNASASDDVSRCAWRK